MIDLYFWPTPNGWKVSIALEEFGLPYRTHLVDISAGDQHTDAFLAISPNGKMPAIVDPDGPTARPSRSLKAGRSCNISRARPAGMAAGRSGRALPWISG